jgi:hypothetical protein
MTKRVEHYCDLCGRNLPVLGSRCTSEDTSTYTWKRSVWRFFSRFLCWKEDRVEKIEICGDCMTEIRNRRRAIVEAT